MCPGTSIGLLFIRLALGIIFVAHGGQKVFGWWGGEGMEPLLKHIAEMGLPNYLAYISAYTELIGGAALVAGLLTRLAAAGLAINMGVAIWKVHLAHGLFLKDGGMEYAIALGAMALCLVLAGGGSFSLDKLCCRKKCDKENSSPE